MNCTNDRLRNQSLTQFSVPLCLTPVKDQVAADDMNVGSTPSPRE